MVARRNPRITDLPARLSAAQLRRYSVAASVDERTILKVAAGLPVRGMAGERARSVLERAGYPLPGGDGVA